MDKLFSQLEAHPVLVSIIIFLLGGISFLIKYFFNRLKKKNSNHSFIKAGGNISAGGDIIVDNKTVHSTTTITANSTSNNLEKFEYYIENSKWKKKLLTIKNIGFAKTTISFKLK